MRLLRTRAFDLIRDLNQEIFPGEPVRKLEQALWWRAVGDRGQITGFAGMRLIEEGQTVFLCRAGVRDGYRGRGLQLRMIRIRVSAARKLGARVAVTYTRPDNVWSSNNLIRAGFEMYRPAEYWAGREMLYWWKDL